MQSSSPEEQQPHSPLISPSALTHKVVTNLDGSSVDVDDNTLLSVLDKEHILANLKNRFNRDCIYTFTASVLLSVNPYKPIANLYSPEMQMLYTNKSLHSLPPHPYALADTAYRYFSGDSKSQVLVVSGESGSGKTETAKTIIAFLASHRERRLAKADGQAVGPASPAQMDIHERVINATPILEAFGNASTIRNKNSSRFGKYHRLLYDKSGKLTGAEIKPFLLEASRVTSISSHERNFHVFYQILAGMSEQELSAKFGLSKTGVYPVISHGLRQDAAHIRDDAEKFDELVNALRVVGFSQQDRDAIFSVIAGLLVLSQVEFAEEVGAVAHKDEDGKATKPVEVVNSAVFDQATALLGLNQTQLHRVLVNKTVKITNRTSAYSVPRSLSQVEATRATIVRTIYRRLFERIVETINTLVAAGERAERTDLHIGILDIFGFENLEKNSFEQLCINLTNEKLQQFFIRKVLESEQKTYQAEGIHTEHNDVMKIPLPDCSETLGCIKGALELLDDHCIRMTRNMPTDEEKYCTQVHRQFHGDQADSKLQIPKPAKAKRLEGGKVAPRGKTTEGFIIRHYAGDVLYSVGGWLEKTNERMSPEMECLLRDSTSLTWVASLADKEACSYACEKFKSVGSKFMTELESMLVMLDKCSLHYIRCFNPNSAQRSREFTTQYVEDQVVQCGTVELVSVMHHGFPNRQPLSAIAENFQSMLPHDFRNLGPRDFTSVIMNAFEIPPTEYAIGFTTLFLKADQIRLLEQLRGVGELPSARILSVIRRQVMEKKLRRCFEVVKVVNWLPKLAKQLRRKKLFTLGAKLAVTISFVLPKARIWLAVARDKIRIRREEEERIRLEQERIRLEEEARLRAEEEERQRIAAEEERIRIEAEEAERARVAEVERLRLLQVEKARIAEAERLAAKAAAEEEVRRMQHMSPAASHQRGSDGEWVSAISHDSEAHDQIGHMHHRVTPSTTTVPQLGPHAQYGGKENSATRANLPGGLGKTSANLGNSLAKLPPVTAMMATNIALFSVPQMNVLIIYDGKRVMPITTNEHVAVDPRSRRSSIGSALPSVLPSGLRGALVGAIAQHPFRKDVFATTEADEVGAVTIWRASKGVESRFRIHLGSSNSTTPQSTVIQKICFIAPDSSSTPSPVLNPSSHLLAVLVECTTPQSVAQYLIFVEVAIGASASRRNSTARKSSIGGGKDSDDGPTAPLFRVHKVEPIPPSQFISAINRKVSFVKTSASGRIVTIGGKGLLMFFAVGVENGSIQVDLLAEQTYFPQIQTTTFLSFISLFPREHGNLADPEEYQEEQLIVSSADGNMLRFPVLINQTTCALDISGCGRVKECMATLSGKRITSLVKKTEEAYYSITADGCIDQWLWVDRRPFRDQDSSIALVSEGSKAMFSSSALLSREVVCFDASAGKVVAFDPTDPDSLNPRLLYQFNSQGVLN